MPSLVDNLSTSALSSAKPFPGLRPFEEVDANWFFGRSTEINDLLKRLRRVRFVAIVGPSGCGKSSMIKAGLLPLIRDGYLDSTWRIGSLRPGEQPLDHLAQALARAISGDPEAIRKQLDAGSLGLIAAIQAQALPSDHRVFLLVDQFEELFQFAQRHGDQPQEEAKAFLKLLLAAADSDDVPFYLVVTMRMEWLSECSTYLGLAEAITRGIYLVPQMSRRQFQQVILDPIEASGGLITTTLLDRMLNDVGDRSDQLPVLQHALMRLWEFRKPGEALNLDGYEKVGTLFHCLSDHAEEVYRDLTEQQKRIAEILFRSITQVYKNRKIRRPRPFGELASLPGMSMSSLQPVIEAFAGEGRSFLFTSEGPLLSASVIDIAHEALMRQWGRLAKWVDDEAELENRLLRLREDAAEWERSSRKDRSVLYRGYKLRRAEEARPQLTDSELVLDFLKVSHRADLWDGLLRKGVPIIASLLAFLALLIWLGIQADRNKALAVSQAEVIRLTQLQLNGAQLVQSNIRQEVCGSGNPACAQVQKTLSAKRIYLQYVADDAGAPLNSGLPTGLALAKIVGSNLKEAGYTVPGYEKVSTAKSPSSNQVRYFYTGDIDDANAIATLLGQWVNGGAQSAQINNPNNVVPQGQFEVWLAATATGKTAAPAPSANTPAKPLSGSSANKVTVRQ
jgi:AAA ATPase domain